MQVNVNFSVSTARNHAGGAEVYLHPLLTLALDGGEWLTSCANSLPLGENPITH